MNNFFSHEQHLDYGKPRSVYARVHNVDPLDPDHFHWVIQFESVNTKSIDQLFSSGRQSHVELIEKDRAEFFDGLSLYIHAIFFTKKDDVFNALSVFDLTEWLYLEFDDYSEGIDVEEYPGLFVETPQPRKLTRIEMPDPHVVRRLKRAFDLPEKDSDAADIAASLVPGDAGDHVLVCDVGQGNCNAIRTAERDVLLYYDFGGGVLKNAATFSDHFRHWCWRNGPAIILSHWDWDHWSSAFRDERALEHVWIAPRQRMGGVQASFAHEIERRGGILLIWPQTSRTITAGRVCVQQGTGRGRNNSGLLMKLKAPGGLDDTILLSGDVAYKNIPDLCSGNYVSIVVPHHGGQGSDSCVPNRPGRLHDRLVYSVGHGNGYTHPFSRTLDQHDASGWCEERGYAHDPVRRTDRRTSRQARPEHIELHFRWRDRRSRPRLGGLMCRLSDGCDLHDSTL